MDKLHAAIASTFPDDAKPDEITIWHYRDDDGGFRIGEIDAIWNNPKTGGMGGITYMQSDIEAGPIIFAAERFLLDCDIPVKKPEGWDSNLDYAQEVEQRLVFTLTGKWPKWVEKEI